MGVNGTNNKLSLVKLESFMLQTSEIIDLRKQVWHFTVVCMQMVVVCTVLKNIILMYICSQVEDRRLELERKYLTMQTQHECLLKTHNVTKQHLHKLKVRSIAVYLELASIKI